MCKLCGKAHWTYEEHDTGLEEVRKLGADVLGYEKRIPVFPDPNPPESVTTVTKSDEVIYVKTCNACNKPFNNRGKVCNACRQRTYRERSRG